eukprot:gene6061-6763_t
MESSFVDDEEEKQAQIRDNSCLTELRSERSETICAPSGADDDGNVGKQKVKILSQSMHLTNEDVDKYLEDEPKSSSIPIHLITSTEDISNVDEGKLIQTNESPLPPSTCPNDDKGLGLSTAFNRTTSNDDHIMCGDQLMEEDKPLDCSKQGGLIQRNNEVESSFMVVINDKASSSELEANGKSIHVKGKVVGSQKRPSKTKSKPAKMKKMDHSIDPGDVTQNGSTFLNGTTMILEQQGNTITQMQPISQIGGQLYTVQLSQGDHTMPATIDAHSVSTVQPSLTFDSIPSATVPIEDSPSAKIDSVNQHWFTEKDEKSSMHMKGIKWKQGMWSKEEVALLKENIDRYCKVNNIDDPSKLIFCTPKDERKHFYRSIAKGICRPLFAIYRKTLRLYDQKNYIGKYTDEEVVKLEELLAKYGHDWATIGHYLGRSAASVKDRCRLLRKNKKTGRWTEEEETILSQCVREQTNTKEGESVTTGVTWSTIAEKLGTRTEKQCRSKWLNYLNWKEVSGKEWTKNDEAELIERIASLDVEEDAELDWIKLAEQWPSARSPQWLRGKWWAIKKHVPDYKNLSFDRIMDYLQTTYLDALRVKIDRQTVALASTFSVSPTSLSLHNADHLSSHVVAANALLTNDSTSTVTDADSIAGTHSHTMINTSAIDLTPLQGYQLQFQLASISPHQILIPVNSTGMTSSNIGDHFVIPVNMTHAIITSTADQQLQQQPTSHQTGGYIVHDVTTDVDNHVNSNARNVELSQALVQTDLSIPIPAGEISEENLTAANIEAISDGMVVSLDHESPLTSATVARPSPPHFVDTMNLMQDDRNQDEHNEIIVSSEHCRVETMDDFDNDSTSVKVVKVDQIVSHDLDSPL